MYFRPAEQRTPPIRPKNLTPRPNFGEVHPLQLIMVLFPACYCYHIHMHPYVTIPRISPPSSTALQVQATQLMHYCTQTNKSVRAGTGTGRLSPDDHPQVHNGRVSDCVSLSRTQRKVILQSNSSTGVTLSWSLSARNLHTLAVAVQPCRQGC